MTAGQMLTFTRHSPQLFLQLGVLATDDAFLVWQQYVIILNMLMQHSITIDQVSQLNSHIISHQLGLRKLSAIYPNLWKPKHHYACHFPLDILHFGPPRHYWCMQFEATNQVFKKIAIGGSYRDTTRRLAEFWCMRSALARQRDRPWDDWACTRVLANSGVVTSARASAPSHVLKALELWPDTFGDYVRTSLISELQHDGHTILAASSWLYFTTDST